MHPNVFLRTFWRMELKPQVFVAMSFSPRFQSRFDQIIKPAIEGISCNGVALTAYRVDLSKSGDSILTEIMDGVAHSQLVLADVSTAGTDKETGVPYRNGNVLYEVGVALACRQPSEVLLIRDDHDKFLFDVSTIPHLQIDFSNPIDATKVLQSELIARLKEQSFVDDARVHTAIAGLSDQEIKLLAQFAEVPEHGVRGWPISGTVLSVYEAAIMRLLDKQVIRLVGQFDKGFPAYQPTRLGRVVAALAAKGMRVIQTTPVPESPQV